MRVTAMADPRIASARDGARSAMGRASGARPPRYYGPARGREEPPAVTAARERQPDGDELAELDAARGRYQAALAAVPEPYPPARPPVTAASRCGRCGYLTAAAGHRVTCGD